MREWRWDAKPECPTVSQVPDLLSSFHVRKDSHGLTFHFAPSKADPSEPDLINSRELVNNERTLWCDYGSVAWSLTKPDLKSPNLLEDFFFPY